MAARLMLVILPLLTGNPAGWSWVQESERSLAGELAGLGIAPRLIGGADVAAELDAVRAIDQATRLAITI